MSRLKIYTAVLLALLFTIGLNACNTVEGVGKDIKSTGSAIEDAGD